MIRSLKASHTTWKYAASIRRTILRDIFANEATKEVFNEKFFEMVQRRKEANATLALKINSIQFPIFLFLALSLIPSLATSVSFFGITASSNVREILVLVSATIGIFSALLGVQQTYLRDILLARNEIVAGEDKNAKEVLDVAYGLELLWLTKPADQHVQPSAGQVFAMALFAISAFGLIAGALAINIGVHIMVLIDVYSHPNFSPSVTWFVIVYVLLADFVTMWMRAHQHGFLSFNDYNALYALLELSKRDPKRAQQVYERIAAEYGQRSGIGRLLRRPRIPKDI